MRPRGMGMAVAGILLLLGSLGFLGLATSGAVSEFFPWKMEANGVPDFVETGDLAALRERGRIRVLVPQVAGLAYLPGRPTGNF